MICAEQFAEVAANVVADTGLDCAEIFPAVSYAATVYEYEVEGVSAQSVVVNGQTEVLVAALNICVPFL